MRGRTLMFAASLWLAASPLHASEMSAGKVAADSDMQQLLQQMAGLPEAERLLMEQALGGSAISKPAVVQASTQQQEMLSMLKQMQLPESERRLMEQAILAMEAPVNNAPVCVAQPVAEDGKSCKSA